MKILEVSCPSCKKKTVWSKNSEWRPFCSERCRLIDLGKWADGGHAIPGEAVPNTESDDYVVGDSSFFR